MLSFVRRSARVVHSRTTIFVPSNKLASGILSKPITIIGFRSIKSNITNGSITLLIDSNSLKNASEPYSLAGKRISLNLTP